MPSLRATNQCLHCLHARTCRGVLCSCSAHLIKPFQLGLSVFGSITLLLAGLIRSSRYYSTRGAEVRAVSVLACMCLCAT